MNHEPSLEASSADAAKAEGEQNTQNISNGALESLRQAMMQGFRELNEGLKDVNDKVDRLERRFGGLEGKVETLDGKVTTLQRDVSRNQDGLQLLAAERLDELLEKQISAQLFDLWQADMAHHFGVQLRGEQTLCSDRWSESEKRIFREQRYAQHRPQRGQEDPTQADIVMELLPLRGNLSLWQVTEVSYWGDQKLEDVVLARTEYLCQHGRRAPGGSLEVVPCLFVREWETEDVLQSALAAKILVYAIKEPVYLETDDMLKRLMSATPVRCQALNFKAALTSWAPVFLQETRTLPGWPHPL